MISTEYGYYLPRHIRRRIEQYEVKKRKPRQEICAFLKWLCFFINFIAFPIGVSLLALGIYLCVKDPRSIQEWADIIMNPAIVLTIIGLLTCIMSLMGSIGALRDNIFLLKSFSLCVFCCYVTLILSTFIIFILFYSDTAEGISAHSILLYSVKNYHRNRNIADFIDNVQEQLECCGVSSASQGYRDWRLSEQFNCSQSNPYPERCGVPFSCCRRSVISEAAGSANPLLPAIRSLECWQNAQKKHPQAVEANLHVRGCLQPIRSLFENNAVYIGSFVAIVIVPVCITVCLTNILARQIDHQHYLLEREAQRCVRRRRRDKQKHTDISAKQDANYKFSNTSNIHEKTSKKDFGIPHSVIAIDNEPATIDSVPFVAHEYPPQVPVHGALKAEKYEYRKHRDASVGVRHSNNSSLEEKQEECRMKKFDRDSGGNNYAQCVENVRRQHKRKRRSRGPEQL